ncbi:hypothetical protein PPGU19_098080 (plasmid) [Paraburkholderia sp. PGU19]|nr:hypothetical protein PPGU19_098080 [Paraburkholderia sp. PGU19]
MAHIFFAASIQRHIATPEREIEARTLGEALEARYADPYLNRIYQQKSEVVQTRTTFSVLNQRGEGVISSHRETDDDNLRRNRTAHVRRT